MEDAIGIMRDQTEELVVERGSSVVECRTRNQGSPAASPGSNPTLLQFRSFGVFVLFTTPQSTQLYK